MSGGGGATLIDAFVNRDIAPFVAFRAKRKYQLSTHKAGSHRDSPEAPPILASRPGPSRRR